MQNKPLSRDFLLSRGSCCGSGCLACPYIPKHEKCTEIIDDFFCEICESSDIYTLYEGWTYTPEKLNPYAVGTAGAGLMVFRRMCRSCLDKLKELGLVKQ